jgi:hypothetical protein
MLHSGTALRATWVVLLTLLAATAGCQNDSADDAATTGDPAFDGLSREEMERQASQMTPAEAESLGIVDTMIRAQPPTNPDTAFILEGIRRTGADTTRRP